MFDFGYARQMTFDRRLSGRGIGDQLEIGSRLGTIEDPPLVTRPGDRPTWI
jgi:hypothetical protein